MNIYIQNCLVRFSSHSTEQKVTLYSDKTIEEICTLFYYLLGKGGYVFGSVGLFVCLPVCLSVCGQHYSKGYERIGMKFYGGVLGSTMKNWLNFGGDLGILRWVNEQKNTIIVVAYPDRGAGNDPKPFFFEGGGWGGGGGRVVSHHQGSTFLQWAIWE